MLFRSELIDLVPPQERAVLVGAPLKRSNARLLADGIARIGVERLPWTKPLKQWRDRVMFLRRAEGDEWPDLSDAGLAANMDWLLPLLSDKTTVSDITGDELSTALQESIPWNMKRRVDAEAPTHFAAPSGSSVPIDYEAEEGPKLSIRVQELFGLDRHPSIANGKVALVVELLSPAHRPVQVFGRDVVHVLELHGPREEEQPRSVLGERALEQREVEPRDVLHHVEQRVVGNRVQKDVGVSQAQIEVDQGHRARSSAGRALDF